MGDEGVVELSKRRKRLERIRRNPTNVSLEELRSLLDDYGFQYRQTVGSHDTFRYRLLGEFRLFVLQLHRPLKTIYVKRAVKLIDQIIEEQGDYERDED